MQCKFTFITTLAYSENHSYAVGTNYPITILVHSNLTGLGLLNTTGHFQEASRYFYNVEYNRSSAGYTEGKLIREKSGDNAYLRESILTVGWENCISGDGGVSVPV